MKIVFPEFKNQNITLALNAYNTMRQNGMQLNFGKTDNTPLVPIEALPAKDLASACKMVTSGQADTMIAGVEYSSRDVILACREYFGMAKLPPTVPRDPESSISTILQDLPSLELNQPDNTSITSKIKQKLLKNHKNTSKSVVKTPSINDLLKNNSSEDEDQAKAAKSAYHIPTAVDQAAQPAPPPSPATPKTSAEPTYSTFSGLAVMQRNDETYLLADMAACKHPSEQQLIEIIWQTYFSAKQILSDEPRIALLSFSTNGSGGHDETIDLLKNCLLQFKNSGLAIDGEMQLDAAIVPEVGQAKFPNSPVAGHANVLIAPDLNSGNLLYKAFERIGNFIVAGPILQGFNYPVSDLSRGSTVADIVLTIQALARLTRQ